MIDIDIISKIENDKTERNPKIIAAGINEGFSMWEPYDERSWGLLDESARYIREDVVLKLIEMAKEK